MIIDQLADTGMKKQEAQTYLAILELGEATIAQIVRKASIKRSTVYDMLELLKEKRIVSQSRRGKRPVFIAENPSKLIEALQQRAKRLENSLPEILALMNILDKKPRLRYFEGIESVREIFEDTLRYSDSEILSWFPYPYLSLGEDFFWKHYNPTRMNKKIWIRSIVPDMPKNRELAKILKEKWLGKTKFVRSASFSGLDIEIKIYGGNKVGIVSYTDNLAILIESQKIFSGIKSIFEAMWEGLPEN